VLKVEPPRRRGCKYKCILIELVRKELQTKNSILLGVTTVKVRAMRRFWSIYKGHSQIKLDVMMTD
jgi:hypothetical protein